MADFSQQPRVAEADLEKNVVVYESDLGSLDAAPEPES